MRQPTEHIRVQYSQSARKLLQSFRNSSQAVIDRFFDPAFDEMIRIYKPQKVILFGSRVWGAPGPDSDIDLLIIKKTSKNFVERYGQVRKIFRRYMPIMPMDIIVLTPEELKENSERGNDFIRKVMEEGEVLFDGKRRLKKP